MRIAILCNTFTPNMGYIGNMLPKYLATLGAEVFVLSMDLPHNYSVKAFDATYRDFANLDDIRAGTVKMFDGYQLHILPHARKLGQMRMVGLREKLESIKPDIVQTFAHIGWIALDAAWHQPRLRYRLFTGNHTTASVFPLAQRPIRFTDPALWRCRVSRTAPGKFVNARTTACYAATRDCADVAINFFGVEQEKIITLPLGVDCEIFHPVASDADREKRDEIRQRYGFTRDDVVCLYSGRLTEDKNPLLLAQAIAQLSDAQVRFKGLFMGSGVQKDAIAATPNCVVHPFVPVHELGDWFRATDIGVWPTQESTSMLDAAACGLPVVVNHTLQAVERIDGNGLQYQLGNVGDLVSVLRRLGDPSLRAQLGGTGARRMREEFSWDVLARTRLAHYKAAVGHSAI